MNDCRKIVLYIVGSLVVFQFLWFYVQLDINENNETSKASNNYKRAPVLFMAQYRSGSSFGATIFNKHKDVFYMYEPLIAVENLLPNQMHYDLNIIENLLYNCSILDYKKFSDEYKKDYNVDLMPKPGLNCRTNSMCFWYQSEKLCKQPLCDHNYNIGSGKCQRHCSNSVTIDRVEEFCKTKPLVSAKVIRLNQIKRIRERFSDLKIISWRRDPRGTFVSRRDMGTKFGNALIELKKDCKYARENKEIAGVDKNILEVKYEDLVLNSELVLEKVLKFSDLEMDPELLEFYKTPEKNVTDSYNNKSFRMSLKRSDPKETAFRWRHKLTFAEIQKIQETCGEENLIALGYPYFKTEFQFDVWKQRIMD